MRCPKCTQEDYHPYATCAQCGFTGPPAQVEELAHIAYLLSQLDAWDEIGAQARAQLHARYQDRRTRLEIDLGLRPLPLSAEEARKLHWDLVCARALLEELTSWQVQGWMRREPAARLRQGVEKRIDSLRQKVKDTPPAPAFEAVDDRLKLLDYLAGMADTVRRNLYFVDDAAHTSALARLQARRREIEIEAGLRPPEPVLVPVAVPVPMAVPEPVPAPAPARPARPPREPITWDRIGQTLLSQRTLNVLLFLGAFLLMASAATYLVYNWEALPPAAQLAFILLFTLAFYGAGWFLRVRMGLRKSGIAVTAIGSLLVPLDFYAIFLAGGVFPAEEWPWVWLLASAVCLPVYTLTALRLRAEFFGYTTAVAAGSLLLAALQVAGSPPDWWLAAVTALALASVVLAHRLQSSPKAWSILSSPLRFSALVAGAATLLVGLGWWAVGGTTGLPFDTSLALAWALGAALYGYTAFSERSAWLGRAAAGVLPVALALLLRLAFVPLEVSTPWYALGWAALAPAYLWAGYRWLGHARQPAPQPADAEPAPEGEAAAAQGHASPEPESSAGQAAADPVLRAHGQTAAGWGLALMAVAAVWAAFDLQSPTLLAGWAAAATHALLVAGVGLAVRLWQKPRALPAASLLALSATTFSMAAGHLEPAELCVGWALLAVLHVLGALMLRKAPDYAARLFGAALGVNALALLPPLVLAHENWLAYVVGHWIALAAWLVWLDHAGQQPGLEALLSRAGPLRRSALHWLVALPLPLFSALLYTRFRSMDAWLGLVVAGLAWGCCAVGHLRRPSDWQLRVADWRFPWYVVGYGCSLAGPALAFYAYDQPLLAVTVLLGSALYFASSWALRIKWWLVPAGLSLPLGLLLLLHLWAVPPAQQSLVLAGVMAAYLLGGLALERHRGVPAGFMAPLYGVAHGVAVTGLAWGLVPAAEHLAAERPWSDAVRLWTAGGQLLLAGVYALWAWFRAQEGWAHLAAWLGVLAGGVAASAYSMGHGSAAFKAALGAAVYVLLERALNSQALQRRWAGAAQAWPLYRRALLVAGWAVSGGAIGMALIRNLVLLGGGRIQTVWAIAGLLAVTALYAASAWLFRRPFFAWLGGALVIAPWTLLTLWGWFVWPAPALPRFALAWAILACLQLALGLFLTHRSTNLQPSTSNLRPPDYGFPLRVIAHLLLPFALFWAVADSGTSSITWGLAVACYAASTLADHRRGLAAWRAARFLYPAAAAAPVWALYLLHRLAPSAPYEWYGLLLLAFSLPLLALGRRLRRIDPADGLPFYLAAYGVAIVGTLLVGHQQPLLAAALAFDALLCVLSARIFRQPTWGYPAAALAAGAMLVALAQSAVPPDRRGWFLIGLGAVYLALAWVLRRVKQHAYATPPLAMAFLVVALGLPPSSLDDTGAFWGYLVAAGVYTTAAIWLRQPLLLAATAALLAVPYGVAMVWVGVLPADYGLAIFPGVIVALALAHLLDGRRSRSAPMSLSGPPRSWRLGSLLDWWAAPWYAWGYLGALVAAVLSWADPLRLAVALALAALTFLHATWRFRVRRYLLLAGALAQGAALAVIDTAGWLADPAWAALAYLPVTVLTAALALVIELQQREGSPISATWFAGWSRPLYLLLAADLLGGQAAALLHSEPGTVVTSVHALLLALLATVWAQRWLPLAPAGLGIVALFQGMAWVGDEPASYAVGLALLALAYGLASYGLQAVWPRNRRAQIWLQPLEWAGLGLSALALPWAVVEGLDVVGPLIRAASGRAVTAAEYAPQAQVLMWVLSITGLLYLATALVRRLWVLSYGAMALLLGAWALWWRFFLHMPNFQWYAVPAAVYLLGVGWMEWRQGRKAVARWIDRAGLLAGLGSAWVQSMPGVMQTGWPYALIMGAESLLLVWWGSARRQKLFLYVGVVGVVVAALTQSIEPLMSANRWIVFGIVGTLLVGLAILVERKLEQIRELSTELRLRLEGWE